MSQEFKDELKELKENGKLKSDFEYWQLMGMEELLEKMDNLSEKADKIISILASNVSNL